MLNEDQYMERTPDLVARIRKLREAAEKEMDRFTRVSDYDVRRDDVPGYSGMARRTVYVIDGSGTITYTWQGSREQPLPDYDAVIEEARRAAQNTASA